MDIYDLTELLGVLEHTKQLPKFWLQFFPNERLFTTPHVLMDEVSTDLRRLAPFVAPNVQGRVMRQDGYTTKQFAPAYVKPKDVVDPNNEQFFRRRAGESLSTGTFSPEQRWAATVAFLLSRQRIFIDNRLEWMAAKTIITGMLTIEGEDYPLVTINFNRDASLTRTLVGAAQWSNPTTSDPFGDIRAANRASNDLCGATGHTIIMGPNAFDSFSDYLTSQKKDLINNDYRGSRTEVSLITAGLEGVEYMGRVAGSNGAGYEIWVYSQKFENADGVLEDLMDPNLVVGVASMVEGTQCFGAIKDTKARLRALRYFPKMWDVEDPSATYLMTQSAPLTVPGRINATWSLKVQ